MGKIKWTEKKIAELEKQGYGDGKGSQYKPWLEVSDFSSLGRVRRVYGLKTNRVHHLFSDVEYNVFLACEWARSVVDIREQYPLERGITQTIALELGIRHPHYPGTQVPTVMTVDFLLTVIEHGEEQLVAVNAKRDDEAEDSKSLEKLEIQRSYFEKMHIPHHLVYHSQLPQQKVKNIGWVRDAQLKEGEIEPRPGYFAALADRMGRELNSPLDVKQKLVDYCTAFDTRHGLELGTGLRVARILMQERALMTNLESRDLTKESLSTFIMTSRNGQLRAMGGI